MLENVFPATKPRALDDYSTVEMGIYIFCECTNGTGTGLVLRLDKTGNAKATFFPRKIEVIFYLISLQRTATAGYNINVDINMHNLVTRETVEETLGAGC